MTAALSRGDEPATTNALCNDIHVSLIPVTQVQVMTLPAMRRMGQWRPRICDSVKKREMP